MPHGGDLGESLWILLWMVPATIVAIIVGLVALWKRPIKRPLLVAAYLILLCPYAAAAIKFPEEGLRISADVTFSTWITPVVALGLTVAAIYKSTLTLRIPAIIAGFRLPTTAKAAIAATVIVVLVFLVNLPWAGDHRPTDGGLALEVLMVFGTLILAVLALLAVIIQLIRPSPDRALVYSWTAFGVLLGNVSLLMLGYWMRLTHEDWADYGLAPMLLVVSVIALLPALIVLVGDVVHRLRRQA